MIAYPVRLQPFEDVEFGPGYRAVFPDFPEIDRCIGDGLDTALELAVEQLQVALIGRFLEKKPMPLMSPMGPGEIAITSPIHWWPE